MAARCVNYALCKTQQLYPTRCDGATARRVGWERVRVRAKSTFRVFLKIDFRKGSTPSPRSPRGIALVAAGVPEAFIPRGEERTGRGPASGSESFMATARRGRGVSLSNGLLTPTLSSFGGGEGESPRLRLPEIIIENHSNFKVLMIRGNSSDLP